MYTFVPPKQVKRVPQAVPAAASGQAGGPPPDLFPSDTEMY